jgi:flagellar basal-body rod protein FlgG
MSAQQQKLDSISNNLSNVNTEGYKRVDVSFKDLVYENLNRKGYPVTGEALDSSYNGTGVKATDWVRDNRQGNLTETGLTTDLAIDGQGYFEVELPRENENDPPKTAYTRSGSFSLDGNGNLVDKNGNRLRTVPENLQLSENNFVVDTQGRIMRKDGSNSAEVGKINLYTVDSAESLQSIGNSLYTVKTTEINGNIIPVEIPYQTQDANIMQGFLEMSNVDITKEMTDMIITQRAFELSSRAMKTGDEMWGMANNLRSR